MRATSRSRSRSSVAIAVAGVAVAVAWASARAARAAARRLAAPALRRRVAADAGHRPHLRRRVRLTSSAAASRRSTATTTGCQDLFLAGGVGAGGAVPQRSAVGGAAALRAGPERGDGSRATSPAPIRSTSTATASPTSSCSGSARTSCCAASATAGSSGRTSSSGSTAADDWTVGVQRDLGGRRRPADARLRQLPRARRGRRRARRAAPTTCSSGRTPAGPPTTPADSARRRATARCRCCSATGTGSGRRDLRMSNDRHYYGADRRRGAALADRRPARRRGSTRPPTAGSRCRIWGMGIASQDLTGDGMPEVYLTSQADNKLQTLADGPTAADVRRHRARPRRHRHPAVRRRRRPCRRPPGTPSSRTSTTTACMDLFVSKGNVEAQPDYAMKDPSNLLLGQPDGTFVEGAEEAGIVDVRAGPRRGARRPEPGRAARPRRGQPARDRAASGGTSGPGRPTRRRRWATGSGSGSSQAAPNRDAIGAWVEVRVGDRVTPREVTVGGGHAGGQLGWIHFGLGRRDRARRSGSPGRTARWDHGSRSTANQYVTIERARRGDAVAAAREELAR